ncbi:single-stranded-DNA-specific exonuclease RecJ [bacterium]|nr:single-stranded-DNA-specific exonuclease RecJ [bacterium]
MNWHFLNPDPKLVNRLKSEFNSSEIIARVLANRGIESVESSKTFFNPQLDQLHNPYDMQDMDKATDRVMESISANKTIMIYGDYDVDGTTGASMLYLALTELGANITPYIPNRESEGYGLSTVGIDIAAELGVDLIISCDCGINAFEPIKYANSLKIDVIITDHHIPDDTLPEAFAILNPKRTDCDYPFKNLCGGGVAFKLVCALTEKMNQPIDLMHKYLDLVTLGTCADMVTIKDENRVIVKHGLKLLANDSKPGITALLKLVGLENKSISVGQLVFGVAPKINAAGRLGDANRSVELLTTSNKQRAKSLADELMQENQKRQIIQQEVVDAAFNMIHANIDLKNERAIVLAGKEWHPGVIGIVASKVKEEFHRPAVIVSYDKNGIGKGSARSISGLDLYDALAASSKHLIDFGGHAMAAGLTVKEKSFNDFKKTFIEYVNNTINDEHLIQSIKLEGVLKLKDINSRFIDFLNKLAPYGPGNMRPSFASKKVEIVGNPRVVGNGDHIIFKVRQSQKVISAIGFNMSEHYEKLIKGLSVDLAYVVEVNEWQGRESVQLNVRDIKMSDKLKGL